MTPLNGVSEECTARVTTERAGWPSGWNKKSKIALAFMGRTCVTKADPARHRRVECIRGCADSVVESPMARDWHNVSQEILLNS